MFFVAEGLQTYREVPRRIESVIRETSPTDEHSQGD